MNVEIQPYSAPAGVFDPSDDVGGASIDAGGENLTLRIKPSKDVGVVLFMILALVTSGSWTKPIRVKPGPVLCDSRSKPILITEDDTHVADAIRSSTGGTLLRNVQTRLKAGQSVSLKYESGKLGGGGTVI